MIVHESLNEHVAWGTEPGFSPVRVIALGGKPGAREK